MARAGSLAQLERRTLVLGTQALYRDPALYEQLYLRRREDVRFYVEQALRTEGPVLEIGAGSGRITLELAKAGVHVVGVDTMPAMLAHSRARLASLPPAQRSRVTLLRGDVRTLRLRKRSRRAGSAALQRFPLIIAPFNVLQHLYTTADLERALRTCAAHLAPGGELVFDVLMPDLAALAQNPDRLYRVGSVVHPLTKIRYDLLESSHYDAMTQIRTTHIILEPHARSSRDTPSTPALAVPLTQRQIFPAELELLLRCSGLEIVRLMGDFTGGPCHPTAHSQVVIARARKTRPA